MKGLAAILLLLLLGCTTSEGETIGAAEANGRILLAMAAKNSECGVTQALTFPAIFPVKETSVDLCVAAIMGSSCASWSLTNPMPAACLGLPFDKKQSRENYGF
jgi:hypothetical protein